MPKPLMYLYDPQKIKIEYCKVIYSKQDWKISYLFKFSEINYRLNLFAPILHFSYVNYLKILVEVTGR